MTQTIRRIFLVKGAVAGLALAVAPLDLARAADAVMPFKASRVAPVFDWSGLHIGGHVGYGGGSFGPGTNPLPQQGIFFPSTITGLIGGYQAGYNLQLPSKWVFGVEADISFTSTLDRPKLVPAPFNTTFDYFGTARGRVGYAFGTVLPYVTGGAAFGRTRVDLNNATGEIVGNKPRMHLGWVAGAGIEVSAGGNWTGKVEYNYIDLGARTYGLGDVPLPDVAVDPTIHTIKVGLNYRLWDTPPWIGNTAIKPLALPESTNWNVHGQTTLITQGYPSFRAPYQGPNSLPGIGRTRQTWTFGAFLGWRLWDGSELYFNPELAQGFGIGGTLGLAGFSNGEAQKGGAEYPEFRAQRYFFRQTFGLGGEQEDVADAANQLSGKRDINRVTVTVGRFAVGDYFDGNSYAKDPRADFMNWAMWSSAAYDFPADLPGFTRGAVVELNRKDWAIRAGLFQVPSQPNSDVLTFKTGGAVIEFEGRHTILDQPGKLRVGVFANRGNTANYRNALGISAANPGININDIVPGERRERSKYGFYVNAEQQIATDVGIFARASWNDGQNEILSFTDIDRSVSGGVSINGSHWGRPDDTIGLGGAINGLSGAHRDFLAAGGKGLLIGDGRLNYGTERILETYYALALSKAFTLTADYQLITNPAYNADRGPVSIFSGRLHGEF
ncbi:cell envelope biogenesis protein OmpA [Afipia massiliensis]|uniref:Cell envelope biogenesis protein OmpA n=1 Tax=Afipia massiliensis TaxID=211460 RepID=A0A4U6BNS4_9BRAD|nr:carbohydrate porin [Afipia massiliensis]TKT71561.1 cell envelope biogenesis protein OmpA [Afipia massiliensis]